MILGRRNMEVLGAALAVSLTVAAAALGDEPPRTFTPSSGTIVLADNDWEGPSEVAGPPARLADRSPDSSIKATTTQTAKAASGDSPDEAARVLPPREEPAIKKRTSGLTVDPGGAARPWYRSGPAALGFVLAAIVGVAWCARRYVPSVKTLADGPLKIVGRSYLSPKQSVALLQVGRRHVLVGVTPERLTNLGHITDPDESFNLKVKASGTDAVSAGNRFEEVLAAEAAEYAEFESVPSAAASSDNSSQLRETMGELRSLMGRLRTLQGSSSGPGMERGEE